MEISTKVKVTGIDPTIITAISSEVACRVAIVRPIVTILKATQVSKLMACKDSSHICPTERPISSISRTLTSNNWQVNSKCSLPLSSSLGRLTKLEPT